MTDRDMVIKGLEAQIDDLQKYADSQEPLTLSQEEAKTILALLKEHDKLDEHLRNEYQRGVNDGWQMLYDILTGT